MFVLSDLRPWLYLFQRRRHAERSVKVFCGKNHALALNAHQCARSKVGNEEHVATDEVLRFIESRDTRHDGTVCAGTVV